MDIEQLRQSCLILPAVMEEIKWGADLVFTVGGKMFCIAATEGNFVFSVKVSPGAFDEWCATPGVVPAPYLARAGWVQFQEPGHFSFTQVNELITESYRLVAAKLTRRQKSELGLV